MKTLRVFKLMSVLSALSFGIAASAATVYCPGNSGTYTDVGDGFKSTSTITQPDSFGGPPPGSGYDAPTGYTTSLKVVGGKDGGLCYYIAGSNLDNGNYWEEAGLNKYLFKETSGGVVTGDSTLMTWTGAGATSGTFTLKSGIWSDYSDLYIGFHFGQGNGDPDSFIVQLEPNITGGSWLFPRNQGQSNIYLFGTRCTEPDGCNGGGENVPEPGSLALLGAGLAGLALVRRRRTGKQ